MAISINAFIPDSELTESKLHKSIILVAIKIQQQSKSLSPVDSIKLEVNFMLPGKTDTPSFKGMRIRHFDLDTNQVIFDVSVPEKMNESPHSNRYVVAVLMDAVDNAAEFLQEQSILFNTSSHQTMLEAIDKEITP